MEFLKIKTFDDKQMQVCVWDDVKNAKGTVVISHGMCEHPERYDNFAKFLNSNGYIVLADNHRAHKYNIAGEKGKVDGDSFTQTLQDIRTVIEYATEKYGFGVVLLGHSYGSFLTQRFIEKRHKMLKGAVLSGTAYMKGKSNPLLIGFVGLISAIRGINREAKFIDGLSFSSYNKGFEDEGTFAWLSRDKEQVAKYNADEYCGYIQSNGFYYYFLKGINKLYRKDAKKIDKNFPVMIAFGSDDPVSNKGKLAYKLKDFYTNKLGLEKVELKEYKGARHEILNETNNDEVYADMLTFINKIFDK